MTQAQPLADAQVALLGLLSERPMHAWEIERTARHRDLRSWTELSTSTIYKHLTALEKNGHLESREEVADGRLRKVYSITDQGAVALRGRLRGILSEPRYPTWRIDLATYNLDLLPREEALECLEAYRAELGERMRGYRELDAYLDGAGCGLHRRAVARRSLRLLEGDAGWVDEFLDELRQG